jgi:hypothetical protein
MRTFLVAIAFLGGFMTGLGILGWQVIHWLKHGDWYTIPTSRVVGPIWIKDWVGAQMVVDYVLGSPLAITGPIFLFFVGWVLASGENK